MSTPVPKILGHDSAAKPRPFIASLDSIGCGRIREIPFQPEYDYMRNDKPNLLLAPNYAEPPLEDIFLCTVDGVQMSTFPAPPPGLDPSHEPTPDGDICLACEDIDICMLLGLGGGRRFHLGSAAKLMSCSDCNLCRLLTRAFERDTGFSKHDLKRKYPNSFVVITSDWATFPVGPRHSRVLEIVGRLLQPPAFLCSEARLRLLADQKSRLTKSQNMRGRVVGSMANMSLARSWLAECEDNHDCNHTEKLQRQINQNEMLLVLDVEKLCLVEIPSHYRYLVLSYVWPRLPSEKLYRNLVKDWMKSQALCEKVKGFLNVFQDAITVTQALGEKYIWIDQLCMAQDDPALKEYLVERMDKVYGRAVLNIIVATSAPPSEDYSIPGVSRPRNILQEASIIDNLHLITALPDFSVAVERTWWATRGWTFQEGVLPRRCLIFHDDQMYFRCCKDARSEDVTAEGNTQFEFHPAKPKIRKSGFEHYLNPALLSNASKQNCFEEYVRFVRDYSRRSLTHGGDILPAFKGIMMALSEAFATLFFCGMPTAFFHRALLWYPAAPLQRRNIESSESTGLIWPSWSWPGWIGKIDYEFDILHLGDARSVLPTTAWYRYNPRLNILFPIGGKMEDVNTPPDPQFALGVLYGLWHRLRENQTRIIGWVSVFRIILDPEEKHIMEWLTDLHQSVPCFAILDRSGDNCGYLPSVDRAWAQRYKQNPRTPCEVIILSYGQHTALRAVLLDLCLFIWRHARKNFVLPESPRDEHQGKNTKTFYVSLRMEPISLHDTEKDATPAPENPVRFSSFETSISIIQRAQWKISRPVPWREWDELGATSFIKTTPSLYQQQDLLKTAAANGWNDSAFRFFMQNHTGGSMAIESSQRLGIVTQTPLDDLEFFSLCMSKTMAVSHQDPDWLCLLFAGPSLPRRIIDDILLDEPFPSDCDDFMVIPYSLARWQVGTIASGVGHLERDIIQQEEGLTSTDVPRSRELALRDSLYRIRKRQFMLQIRCKFAQELARSLNRCFDNIERTAEVKYSSRLRDGVQELESILRIVKHDIENVALRVNAQQAVLDNQTSFRVREFSSVKLYCQPVKVPLLMQYLI
ncbi:hypothetical protein UA08_07777 [Talaromyces atroroseus]|uniref:Heterokaryon incompatibility domain-containing protein n=1 Tax=Talaromyces atroroseus TaxID=1441469 RepID=A0A225A885_TALAT|nr:hypothetical protein UA08_07777 [Talaromyces atroroseus]OKL56802.1 hypothetical protein UA08_07777 [Talaromyces atroroseus]